MQNHFFFLAGALSLAPFLESFPAYAAPSASFFLAAYLFSNSAKFALIVAGSNFNEI